MVKKNISSVHICMRITVWDRSSGVISIIFQIQLCSETSKF